MTSNDSTTTPRYNVWSDIKMASAQPPKHDTIESAREEIAELISEGNKNIDWRIWDHSTTPPTDVTDNNPEGPHMTTPHPGKRTPALTIPECANEIRIKRSQVDAGKVYVTIHTPAWHAHFACHEEEVLTELHRIAAVFEENQK